MKLHFIIKTKSAAVPRSAEVALLVSHIQVKCQRVTRVQWLTSRLLDI